MAQLSITETIIYGLFQTSLFVVLLALTQNYRYSKRDYVVLLLGYMIPSLALYFIVGVASIIFVITFWESFSTLNLEYLGL
ncbi:hypothetical protein [Mammaliicoccus sciuri]|uniref:hypothetical protein n=1 Tax=Mammaliicoccus sciuri TaxID=1296 RepID=UPI0021753197|nr:hypothetical protein [Mammaliicoccus sciuri]